MTTNRTSVLQTLKPLHWMAFVFFLPRIPVAKKSLNTTGLRCPQPVFRLAAEVETMKRGDMIEITADCPTFEQDLKTWAKLTKRTVTLLRQEGAKVTYQLWV